MTEKKIARHDILQFHLSCSHYENQSLGHHIFNRERLHSFRNEDVGPSFFSFENTSNILEVCLPVNWSAVFLISNKYFLKTIIKFISVFGTTEHR